jgi:hypothetical protein
MNLQYNGYNAMIKNNEGVPAGNLSDGVTMLF